MARFSRRQFVRGVLAGSLLAVTGAACAQGSGPSSVLIAGGMVVDGTGAKAHRADVRVSGNKIAQIGRLKPQAGERVIDANGMVVAPGFIDTHSHVDGGLLESPDAETHIRQGITTSIVGQDGGSHFPLKDYFAQLEKTHVALNIASFAGHGTIRGLATGKDYKRKVTDAELQKMRDVMAQEMQAGALGLSSGLEYDPGFYSTTEELTACAEVAGKYGGLYISHVRDEGNEAIKSFEELITIAEKGHLPAQISHIKLDTSPSWGKASEVLNLIDAANKRGVDISVDVYPYLYWQSTITVLIPSRDWQNRSLWEKGMSEVGGAEHVRLTTYSPDKDWQGKTIAEIAAMTGKDAITVVQEVVQKTHGVGATGSESVVVTAMTEDDLSRFIASPRVMFCTDGSLRPTHPRGAGSFPRLLGVYVREKHLLTLEQAIHKMTGLPARRMGFADRGALRPGMKADVVIFNPLTVKDTATVADPAAQPVGLPYVMVNGALVLDNGKITGNRPGAVLRHDPTKSLPRLLARKF
jgi:N-acyl-D-amino-acid deacylase